MGVFALVQLVAAAGSRFQLGVPLQALAFMVITAVPMYAGVGAEPRLVASTMLHLLVCGVATFAAVSVLARTVSIPALDLAALTLAAFAEEVTFRVALPSFLGKQLSLLAHGALGAAILAQLTFAAAHLGDGSAMVLLAELMVLTVNGLLLLVLVRRVGLSAGGTAHAVFNATGSLDAPQLPSQRTVQWWLFLAAAIVGRRLNPFRRSA